jgi:hypothetical protein
MCKPGRGRLAAALLLAVLVVPSLARAQLVDEESVGRLTVGLGVGVMVPSMQDVNDNAEIVSRFLARDEIRGLDPIHEGLLTHLDLRYRLGTSPKEEADEAVSLLDRITIGFAWGSASAKTQFTDVTRAIARFYSRATTYHPYVLYHLPFLDRSIPRAQLVVGGGPLILQSADVEWIFIDNTSNQFFSDFENGVGDISELAGKAEASGSGLGFALQGGGSYMLNSRFSVALDLGYRVAKISDLSLDSAVGQEDLRFPEPDPGSGDVIRRPGDWAVIDFFLRDRNAVYEGRNRTDPGDDDPETGGCAECPLYFPETGPLEVDYSGPFATISVRVHF